MKHLLFAAIRRLHRVMLNLKTSKYIRKQFQNVSKGVKAIS